MLCVQVAEAAVALQRVVGIKPMMKEGIKPSVFRTLLASSDNA